MAIETGPDITPHRLNQRTLGALVANLKCLAAQRLVIMNTCASPLISRRSPTTRRLAGCRGTSCTRPQSRTRMSCNRSLAGQGCPRINTTPTSTARAILSKRRHPAGEFPFSRSLMAAAVPDHAPTGCAVACRRSRFAPSNCQARRLCLRRQQRTKRCPLRPARPAAANGGRRRRVGRSRCRPFGSRV